MTPLGILVLTLGLAALAPVAFAQMHASAGINAGEYDPAQLPGTVVSNPRIPPAAKPAPGKGSLRGLASVYPYTGAVWYQTEVVIPDAWRGKHIELFMERCQWGIPLSGSTTACRGRGTAWSHRTSTTCRRR